MLALPAGSVVLDIGCASGAGTIELARAGYRPIGIELDPDLVRQFRASATAGVSGCRGDATALPMPDGSVDGAVLMEVLEHVERADDVLREIARVVRPGGRVCIAVPTRYSELVYRRLHPRYASNAGHIHAFGRDELSARLRRAGLRTERIEARNFAPALAWFVHSLLRTEATHTGQVIEHRWVDWAAVGLVWTGRRLPAVRRAVAAAERRVGKSWYFVCVAA